MRNSRFRGTLCSKNHELDFYNFSSVGFALQVSRGTSTADFKYIKLVYFANHKKRGSLVRFIARTTDRILIT
jgi:hypothetical protein